jgi:hypothetical protein
MTDSPTKPKSGQTSTQIAEVPTPATRPRNSDPLPQGHWLHRPGTSQGLTPKLKRVIIHLH